MSLRFRISKPLYSSSTKLVFVFCFCAAVVALLGYVAITLQVFSCLYNNLSGNQKTARLTDEKKTGLTHISASLCLWFYKLSVLTCIGLLAPNFYMSMHWL